MNFKRIARALICLVLVCALVVNISPIRAKAIVPESIMIGAGIVIGSIMLGLGLGMAQDSTQNVLTNLVNDCVDVIKSDYDFIDEDALIQVYVDYSAETARYYASQELVEAVQTWLFESDTLKYTSGTTAPDGYAYYNGALFPALPPANQIYNYHIIISDGSSVNLYSYENQPLIEYANYGPPAPDFIIASYSGYYVWKSLVNGSWVHKAYSQGIKHPIGDYPHGDYIVWTSSDLSGFDGLIMPGMEPALTLDSYYESLVEGIALGYVANPDDDLPTGYPVWSGGAISIPGQSDSGGIVIGYPVGLAPTLEGTLGLTQTDVWQGVSTYTSSGGDISDPSDGDDDRNIPFGEAAAGSIIGWLLGDLTQILTDYWGKPHSLHDMLKNFFVDHRNWGSELNHAVNILGDHISTLSDTLSQQFTDLQTSISTMTDSLVDSLTNSLRELLTQLQTLTQTLTQTMTDIKTQALEDIKQMVLPKEGYIDDKVKELNENFPIWEDIGESLKDTRDFLFTLGQQPPVIYINLGSTRGSYNIGGTVPFLDLRWYAEYKPTMDAIISAFLYLWFIWRIMLSLPGIIQGTSGLWNKNDIPAGAGVWERPVARLNSGSEIERLGTSNYHERGTKGRHYIKHD